MTTRNTASFPSREWVLDRFSDGVPVRQFIRRQVTPLNIAFGIIIAAGGPLLIWRYLAGLGAVTHASNDQPWGLFLAWGLFSGVPLASTGFIVASAVYLFGLKQYSGLVRPAILTGLIGYFFAVVFLLVDLGIPWRLPYPIVMSYGTGSVMFLVAWHVALYLSTQLLEFCPAIFEWLGAEKLRRWALKVTVGATIFGVILSTLHQSALGALFLLAPGKMHPLWYSPYLPLLFLVSSLFAGLSMVILEAFLVSRFLPHRVEPDHLHHLDRLTLGLAKAAATVLVTYFGLKLIALAHGNHWALLNTAYGAWFSVEMLAFVLLPAFLFVRGVRRAEPRIVRFTALGVIVGVIANRFTVSMFAFNWQLPHREFFYWKECLMVAMIVVAEIVLYRWVVNHLPVHRKLRPA